MDAVGPRGSFSIVDAANDGSRLQAFASRQFRERWQSEASARDSHNAGLGGSTSKLAHAAVQRGALLVNGAKATGRTVLRIGDAIELVDAMVPTLADVVVPTTQSGERARMVLGDVEPLDIELDGLDERDAGRAAAFDAYYTAQALCPAEEWRRALSAFRRPMPLCFRLANRHPVQVSGGTPFVSLLHLPCLL